MSLLTFIIFIGSILYGAIYTMCAIDNYSRKRYFIFGVDAMVIITAITLIIRIVCAWPLA